MRITMPGVHALQSAVGGERVGHPLPLILVDTLERGDLGASRPSEVGARCAPCHRSTPCSTHWPMVNSVFGEEICNSSRRPRVMIVIADRDGLAVNGELSYG